MKDLVFEITRSNWSEKGPESWNNTIYKVYNDFSVEIIDNYVPIHNEVSKKNKTKNTIIEKNEFEKLKELMEKIYKIKQVVNACDGEAWEFIYYKNNQIYLKREMGYTYGIDILENIQSILAKLN